jgi:DNA-binding NarL/FixJ family response regulator
MTGLRTTVIYDRQPLWSQAIARLSERTGVTVVGIASSCAEALAFVRARKPEILIAGADCSRADSEGLRVVRAARQLSPAVKIVVLGDGDGDGYGDEHVRNAFMAGAGVYCVKIAEAGDLASAIRQAFKHSIYLAPDFSPLADPTGSVNGRRRNALTARERQILQLVAVGHPNSEVARSLWVTDQTVKFHLSNIYRKLGVANRTEASRWAQVNGLLSGGPLSDDEIVGADDPTGPLPKVRVVP